MCFVSLVEKGIGAIPPYSRVPITFLYDCLFILRHSNRHSASIMINNTIICPYFGCLLPQRLHHMAAHACMKQLWQAQVENEH